MQINFAVFVICVCVCGLKYFFNLRMFIYRDLSGNKIVKLPPNIFHESMGLGYL